MKSLLAALLSLLFMTYATPASFSEDSALPLQSVFFPLPPAPIADPAKVRLGKSLFSDKRLSADNTVSCSSCHSFQLGGRDGKQVPIGIHGERGEVNAPTVLNASLNFRQFWDGRASTLEDQAEGPIHNPKEMAADWPEIISKLRQDPQIEKLFLEIYHAEATHEYVIDALVTFEESLITPNAPFDRYLKGDLTALSPRQLRGYKKFQNYGCIACHQGVNVGGNMFQTLGITGNYFKDRGNETRADLGRFNVTGQESDKHVFKVPSLRNVAVTGPYFHDGTVKTLNQAVKIMAKYQLGRKLEEEDVLDIVDFLNALTGELPESLTQ